jgi:iron complex outermembrane receptor protein
VIDTNTSDASGKLGARGTRGAWNWDLSVQYGRNAMDFNIPNTLNASLGPQIPPNKTEFYAGSFVADAFLANLDVSRKVGCRTTRTAAGSRSGERRRRGGRSASPRPGSTGTPR